MITWPSLSGYTWAPHNFLSKFRRYRPTEAFFDKSWTLPDIASLATDKRPLQHLARFILIGLYRGTRASAIASASPYRQDLHSFIDLEQGIFYRLAIGDVADAARRADPAGGRLSRHVSGGARAHLRPPSPRLYARRRAGHHLETIAERFIGHSIGQGRNRLSQAAKNLMISWWAREDSNLQPSGYEPLALTIELRARAARACMDGIRGRPATGFQSSAAGLTRIPPARRTDSRTTTASSTACAGPRH
jgi:hypothetical protein